MEATNPFAICFNDGLDVQDDHFDQLFPLNALQSAAAVASNNNDRMPDVHVDDSSDLSFGELDLETPFGDVISDDDLATLNIKDLNRLLKEKGLSKDTIERLKQRRRTLKNRKYATDCRDKKDNEVHSLEAAKDYESGSISELEQRNEAMREKLSNLKTHYSRVLDFARKNNIQLKQRNVPLAGVFEDFPEAF